MTPGQCTPTRACKCSTHSPWSRNQTKESAGLRCGQCSLGRGSQGVHRGPPRPQKRGPAGNRQQDTPKSGVPCVRYCVPTLLCVTQYNSHRCVANGRRLGRGSVGKLPVSSHHQGPPRRQGQGEMEQEEHCLGHRQPAHLACAQHRVRRHPAALTCHGRVPVR